MSVFPSLKSFEFK